MNRSVKMKSAGASNMAELSLISTGKVRIRRCLAGRASVLASRLPENLLYLIPSDWTGGCAPAAGL